VWGMPLGVRVDSIRSREDYVKYHPDRRAELDEMGFIWDDLERRWEEVKEALITFKDANGDLEVPRKFVVPSEPPWPEKVWGMPLGVRVDSIRSREDYVKYHPDRRAELDEMGFIW